MTTQSIPISAISRTGHSVPPSLEGGDRLPVIEVLAEIASSMSSDANTDQMLLRFLEIMVRISRARAGAVRVLTADGDHLRMIGSIGLSPALLDRERYVPLECGICGQATLTQMTQYDSVLRECQKQVRHIYASMQCNTVYAVPLRHKGKVLGVYNLFMEGETGVRPRNPRSRRNVPAEPGRTGGIAGYLSRLLRLDAHLLRLAAQSAG